MAQTTLSWRHESSTWQMLPAPRVASARLPYPTLRSFQSLVWGYQDRVSPKHFPIRSAGGNADMAVRTGRVFPNMWGVLAIRD